MIIQLLLLVNGSFLRLCVSSLGIPETLHRPVESLRREFELESRLVESLRRELKMENKLVESLRKQLMHDNADYMDGSDSDAITTTFRADAAAEVEEGSFFRQQDIVLPQERSQNQKNLESESLAQELAMIEEVPKETARESLTTPMPYDGMDTTLKEGVTKTYFVGINNRRVNKDDLFNYLDDKRLQKPNNISFNTTEPDYKTSTTKQNQIPEEIQPSDNGRRKGGTGGENKRKVVQEKQDGEIAIVKLGDGPFPEFRLPRNRRQYMAEEYEDINSFESNQISGSRSKEKMSKEKTAEIRRAGNLALSREDQTTSTKMSESEEQLNKALTVQDKSKAHLEPKLLIVEENPRSDVDGKTTKDINVHVMENLNELL